MLATACLHDTVAPPDPEPIARVDAVVLIHRCSPAVWQVFLDGVPWPGPNQTFLLPNPSELLVPLDSGVHVLETIRWWPVSSSLMLDTVVAGDTLALPCP